MTEKLFETALGIGAPWYVARADFDAQAKTLTIRVDFTAGSRFAIPGMAGEHPVHDTVAKRYRHLNFFQHECFLEVRVPRVRLPDGAVRQVEPPWAGKLSGFTLLFEALVLMLCQQMTFTGAARLVGESRHRVAAICERYVALALAQADFSAVHELAIDETSRARGHDYISLAADARERRVLAVAEGRSAETVAALADELNAHGCVPAQVSSVSIDMSPAFIKGCGEGRTDSQSESGLRGFPKGEDRRRPVPVNRTIDTRIFRTRRAVPGTGRASPKCRLWRTSHGVAFEPHSLQQRQEPRILADDRMRPVD